MPTLATSNPLQEVICFDNVLPKVDHMSDQIALQFAKSPSLYCFMGSYRIDENQAALSDLSQMCSGVKANGRLVPVTCDFEMGALEEPKGTSVTVSPSAWPEVAWTETLTNQQPYDPPCAQTSHLFQKVALAAFGFLFSISLLPSYYSCIRRS